MHLAGPAGGKGKNAIGWRFKACEPAEWLACTHVETDSAWLFTMQTAYELAQGRRADGSCLLYWYTVEAAIIAIAQTRVADDCGHNCLRRNPSRTPRRYHTIRNMRRIYSLLAQIACVCSILPIAACGGSGGKPAATTVTRIVTVTASASPAHQARSPRPARRVDPLPRSPTTAPSLLAPT